MLRDLSALTTGGRGILGTNLVGVLASDMPTGFAQPGLLNNDVDANDPAGTLYRLEITSWPSAGTLAVDENGAFSFTGAPNGTYTGGERVYKNGATAYDTTYSMGVGTVTTSVSSDAAMLYVVRALVAADVAPTYTVRALVSSNLTMSYAARALVAADMATAYAIGTASSTDMLLAYAVSSAVASDLTARYSVRTMATSDLALAYAARSSVSSDVAIAFNVETSLFADMTTGYSVFLSNGTADTQIWRGYVPKAKTYVVGNATVSIMSAFTMRGGKPTADMDPDDVEHYGVGVGDILAVLPGVTIDRVEPITQGVTVVDGETVTLSGNDLTVLLSGTGLSDINDNFCTFRMYLSNKEQRDRTIYFRRKDK